MKQLRLLVIPSLLALAFAAWSSASTHAEEDPQKALSQVQAEAAALTKSDVEKIVRDYIKSNPQEILNAVDEYQRALVSEQRKTVLAQNKFSLFKDEAPEAGNPKGDVAVIEFFDYNCGYCKRVLPDIQKLLDEDKNVRFIFKDFPILGPSSELASKWALAAAKQGKYLDYHKALMTAQGALNEEVLSSLAKDLGLDVDRLKKDAQGSDISEAISKNRALAASLGLSGTPAFIIGDEVAPGAITIERFRSLVETARAAAKDKK